MSNFRVQLVSHALSSSTLLFLASIFPTLSSRFLSYPCNKYIKAKIPKIENGDHSRTKTVEMLPQVEAFRNHKIEFNISLIDIESLCSFYHLHTNNL